jgi:hypothetical protein
VRDNLLDVPLRRTTARPPGERFRLSDGLARRRQCEGVARRRVTRSRGWQASIELGGRVVDVAGTGDVRTIWMVAHAHHSPGGHVPGPRRRTLQTGGPANPTTASSGWVPGSPPPHASVTALRAARLLSTGFPGPGSGETGQRRGVLDPSIQAVIGPECPLGLRQTLLGALRWVHLPVILMETFGASVERVSIENPEDPQGHLVGVSRNEGDAGRRNIH